MDIGIVMAIFICSFAIYDAIRKLNNNIIEQTEEIKKLRKETNAYRSKDINL